MPQEAFLFGALQHLSRALSERRAFTRRRSFLNKKMSVNIDGHLFIQKGQIISHSHIRQDHCASDPQWLYFQNTP